MKQHIKSRQIKFLYLAFRWIPYSEAPFFRAALRDHLDDLFPHPLVQFKMHPKNGMCRPILICMGHNVEEVAARFCLKRQVRVVARRHAYSMNPAWGDIFNLPLAG